MDFTLIENLDRINFNNKFIIDLSTVEILNIINPLGFLQFIFLIFNIKLYID